MRQRGTRKLRACPRRTTGAESAVRARRVATDSMGAVTRGVATTTGRAVWTPTRSTEPSTRTSARAAASRISR